MSYLSDLCREKGYMTWQELNRGSWDKRITWIAKGVLLSENKFDQVFMREDAPEGVHIVYDGSRGLVYFHFPDNLSLKKADDFTRKHNGNISELDRTYQKREQGRMVAWLDLHILPYSKEGQQVLEMLIQDKSIEPQERIMAAHLTE